MEKNETDGKPSPQFCVLMIMLLVKERDRFVIGSVLRTEKVTDLQLNGFLGRAVWGMR